ncbi:DUF3298 and DUF4163 domain-containing protein [Treponema brennaborense]|uniref:DUF3298 domain-containing protein n=1 Tax=Treponema brennaborense (strain DSM 12168 / CIP 105900 / DD5/3) TaxID=906968 RepID=F4LLY6_TREBD|nr:DUF3298 and DUF4163 domain-containing protein [Treponema brennaborense]AEE15678.1 hypothetical protein Trebr_0228 [Treponema brennaborense DSM 12168]
MKTATILRKTAETAILCGLLLSVSASCASAKDPQKGVSVIRNKAETDIYLAETELPVFDGREALNRRILQTGDDWFTEFSRDARENTAARLETAAPDQLKEIEMPFCTFNQTWKLAENDADYISCLLESYSYTGGANGFVQLASFTWNVRTDTEAALTDVLADFVAPATLDRLAEICRTQLTERFKSADGPVSSDGSVAADPYTAQMIAEGTAPVPENYRVFTVSDTELTIYFNKYQVAAGSYGVQTVSIPRL